MNRGIDMLKNTIALREGAQFRTTTSVLSQTGTAVDLKRLTASAQRRTIQPKRLCKTCQGKSCIGRCHF